MDTVIVAFMIFLVVLFIKKDWVIINFKNTRIFGAILIGVLCQTILANYLWFYATFKIGISSFQIILATLPLWIYLVDVYTLKNSIPSKLFLFTAVVACIGIGLIML